MEYPGRRSLWRTIEAGSAALDSVTVGVDTACSDIDACPWYVDPSWVAFDSLPALQILARSNVAMPNPERILYPMLPGNPFFTVG